MSNIRSSFQNINIEALFIIATVIILSIGISFSNHAAENVAKELKGNLHSRTTLLASAINHKQIVNFNGDISDFSSEVYMNYRRFFFSACNSQKDIRYIYMMGYRNDDIFFYIDSEPDKPFKEKPPLASPGEIYNDYPVGLKSVFLDGLNDYTVGPYTDKWGTFVSVMLPVVIPETKKVACVIGMDVSAEDWNQKINSIKIMVLSLTITLIIALWAIYLNIVKEREKIKKSQKKLFYQQTVLDLAKCNNNNSAAALRNIVKTACKTLNVCRTGIWRFSEDNQLVCIANYTVQTDSFTAGEKLSAGEFTQYFKALINERYLAVSDTCNDKRTAELSQKYWHPKNINSTLDAMIWLHGRPSGVLCVEHTGKSRPWLEEEIDFTLSIADLISLVYETSERVNAEKDLQESRDFLEKIINSIGDPIFVKDQNYRFVMVNDALCKTMGKNFYEIIGKSDKDFFPPDQVETFFKNDKMVLETGKENISEEILADSTGTNKIINTKKNLYVDQQGNRYIVGVIHDLTERKKFEEESLKMSKIESIGILAGGIAHDFNNILMGILGNLSLAKKRTENDPKSHIVLTRAESVVHKAKALTDQLITFSKGGAPIKKLSSLNSLVKATAEFSLSGSKIILDYHLNKNLWKAEIDEGQFAQIITNIIINAKQALNDEGRISVSTENIILKEGNTPHPPGDYIKLTIKDDGPGIPAANLDKIFDPYFTTKPTGSGLGLFTSYSIIKKHDGFINVDSEPGIGTAFYIYIPAAPGELAKTLTHDDAVKSNKNNYNILVMDDEPDSVQPVCDMLEDFGHRVKIAKNGLEAFEIYERSLHSEGKIDVVIIDIIVRGGMGGAELITRLRRLDPNVRAIVSSGNSIDELMKDYAHHGFSSAIAKPYKVEEMETLIHKIMGEKN